MRCILLVSKCYTRQNSKTDEPLLDLAHFRIREEEAFLTLLATAEAEDLDCIQSKLLPHRLSLDHLGLPAPPCETTQATPSQFLSSLYTADTTLEDQSSPQASVDMEMLDTTVAPTVNTSITQSLMVENTSATRPAAAESIGMYAWSASSPLSTGYLRDLLDSLYGGSSARGLKNIPEIINLGDHFLREDTANFVEEFRRGWKVEGLWYRALLSNPSTGSSTVERMFKCLCCTQTIKYESTVDAVGLRMSRIFLYQYFEQRCIDIRKDPRLPNLLSQGKRVSSVVLDVILEEIYGRFDQQASIRVSKQRRRSLKDHKMLGKRWSILANHLGVGIIMTCSRSLETHMNNTKFTERLIMALLTYILNIYPQSVQVSQMADPSVRCLMGGVLSPAWPAAEILAAIDEYEQQREKECYAEKDQWQPVDSPKGFVPLILM